MLKRENSLNRLFWSGDHSSPLDNIILNGGDYCFRRVMDMHLLINILHMVVNSENRNKQFGCDHFLAKSFYQAMEDIDLSFREFVGCLCLFCCFIFTAKMFQHALCD